MAAQGGRVSGVLEMDEGLLESMVQDGNPEQEMLVVEEQELPQTDPEPEMARRMTPPHPSPVKILPQPPAKPRPTEAIRLHRGRLKSTGWGKC